MQAGHKVEKVLTDAEMTAVKESNCPIMEVLGILEPSLGEMETINPAHYAIPKRQWIELCEADGGGGRDEKSRYVGLQWMNQGPSSFIEAE